MNNKTSFLDSISSLSDFNNFEAAATDLFRLQYVQNPVYRQFCDLLGCKPDHVASIVDIPFLPIRFFKSHDIKTGMFDPQIIFSSSGTVGAGLSHHHVERLEDYHASFSKCFHGFYGDPSSWCILALLPSYLERKGSSLIYMVEQLIRDSNHPVSGFFLNDMEKLHDTITALEEKGQKTLLMGVTFALIDFAENYPMQLNHTIVMETGGMKGRKKEITRQEVHAFLMKRLGISQVHAEYGMTELLSQAYSQGNGKFHSPPWMKILFREENDPMAVSCNPGVGAINIIDLANRSSCAFIATEDLGRIDADGSFEVLGRLDNSDIRGCSLLYT